MDGMDFGGGKMQGVPPPPMGIPGMPPGGAPMMPPGGMGAPSGFPGFGGPMSDGDIARGQMAQAANIAPAVGANPPGPSAIPQVGGGGMSSDQIPQAGMDPQKKMMLAGMLAKLGGNAGTLMRRR
jgi:hypothetical protein